MFTMTDICNIAVQIEENGEASYRYAAKHTNDSAIAGLFEIMADDEQKHAQWFRDVIDKPFSASKDKDQDIEQMGRELLQNMMAQQTFSLDLEKLADADDAQDALRQSIEFEDDTILFYEMLHSFLDDSETMLQLELIINEERTHIDKLNEIMRSLEANRLTVK